MNTPNQPVHMLGLSLLTLSIQYIGSAAAFVHSWIGNVASGSLFSTLQSAGAGGAGLTAVNGFVQTVGSMGASAIAASTKFWDFIQDQTSGCFQEGRVIYCFSQ